MVVYDTRYPLLPNSRPLLLSSQRSQDRKSQLLFPGGGLRRKGVAAISETTRFHYLVLESSWSRPRKSSDGASWHAKKGESEKPWEKPKAMAHARKFTPEDEDPRENQRSRRLGRTLDDWTQQGDGQRHPRDHNDKIHRQRSGRGGCVPITADRRHQVQSERVSESQRGERSSGASWPGLSQRRRSIQGLQVSPGGSSDLEKRISFGGRALGAGTSQLDD